MHTTSLLLFEDDDLDARLITSALAKAAPQIQVRRAHDGTSGLKIMEEDRPGMVLLDLSMPGLSGFQVLETIREDDILARTPVIIFLHSMHFSFVSAMTVGFAPGIELINCQNCRRRFSADMYEAPDTARTQMSSNSAPARKSAATFDGKFPHGP